MDNREQKDLTLEEIIEQSFDFSEFSEEEKKRIIQETSGLIMETALLRALDEAGEEVQEKFNHFLEKEEPNEEEMASFIQKNLPHFNEKVFEELQYFLNLEKGEKDDKEV